MKKMVRREECIVLLLRKLKVSQSVRRRSTLMSISVGSQAGAVGTPTHATCIEGKRVSLPSNKQLKKDRFFLSVTLNDLGISECLVILLFTPPEPMLLFVPKFYIC